MERLLFVSSDGHASARMTDYRDYLDPDVLVDFDDYLAVHERLFPREFERPGLRHKLDAHEYDAWMERTGAQGRLDGAWDAQRRVAELESEGVVAEVLFPDFRRPFDMTTVRFADVHDVPPATTRQVAAGNRAYNRWLADFCAEVPGRFAGMAIIDVHDVTEAVREVEWAKGAGLKGVLMPVFPADAPVFDPRYDVLWSHIEELELVLDAHVESSAVTDVEMNVSAASHPAARLALGSSYRMFVGREMLAHVVWGGVLERHPDLKVVFTELGSDWVVAALRRMDYTYDGSYLRTDIRDALSVRPSEYFARQCFLGSSLLSRAEVEHRNAIGLDKMMIGVDYPHHEGMFGHDARAYLRATLGAASVPEEDARLMLGATAVDVFGFDEAVLAEAARRVGYLPSEVLSPPATDDFPRGDVHRPFA